MNEDSCGLREEDTMLLGGMHCSGVRPVSRETATGCQVTASSVPSVSFAMLALFSLSFFVGIPILLATRNPAILTVPVQAAIFLTGFAAVAVPLIGHSRQFRRLHSISPMREFDAGKQMVSILNGQAEVAVEDIVCIPLPAGAWDPNGWSSDYVVSEAQLVVESPEGPARYRLDSSISSVTQATLMPRVSSCRSDMPHGRGSEAAPLAARQFKPQPGPESTIVSADDGVTFWYSDRGEFGGHGTEVSGTRFDGPTPSCRQGGFRHGARAGAIQPFAQPTDMALCCVIVDAMLAVRMVEIR